MSWRNDQVTEEETEKIIELARGSLDLDGDFVELGCYRGDTSLLLAEIIDQYNKGKPVENSVDKSVKKSVENLRKKQLWIYDSFEGLPGKTRNDESVLGENFRKGELLVPKSEVKKRFLRAGLKVPIIKKGWFGELKKNDLPDKIAFAFLDGDLYDSIRDSIKAIDDKMVKSGIVVVHDYDNPALPGVARAVDEWLSSRKYEFCKYQSMIIITVK